MSEIEIRFLTLNLCCLPSGLRNANLATQTFVGGIISFFSCWICGTSFLWHLLDIFARSPSWTAVATIALLPCLFVGAPAFATAFGRLVGLMYYLWDGEHDHKCERIAALGSYLNDFDVVAFQELYGAWPHCLDKNFPHLVRTLASKLGLKYCIDSADVKRPSMCMNDGLLIVSRFPIEKQVSLRFSAHNCITKYSVARGAAYARIRHPSSATPVHVFTCHMSPLSCSGLGLLWSLAGSLSGSLEQENLSELAAFITEHTPRVGEPVILLGDFNTAAQPCFPQTLTGLETIKSTLASRCGLTQLGPTAMTYGGRDEEETLLTNPLSFHKEEADDFIFTDQESARSCSAFGVRQLPMPHTYTDANGETKKFLRPKTSTIALPNYISDHSGLSCSLRFPTSSAQ